MSPEPTIDPEFTSEPELKSEIATDLQDLSGMSLDAVASALKSGNGDPEETLRRVAPADGTQLLVAASFNSAI